MLAYIPKSYRVRKDGSTSKDVSSSAPSMESGLSAWIAVVKFINYRCTLLSYTSTSTSTTFHTHYLLVSDITTTSTLKLTSDREASPLRNTQNPTGEENRSSARSSIRCQRTTHTSGRYIWPPLFSQIQSTGQEPVSCSTVIPFSVPPANDG